MSFLSRSRGLGLENFMDANSPALNIASRELTTCHEKDPLDRVIPILASKYRRIPVTTREGDFRGLITSTDALDYLGAGPKYSIFTKRRGSLKIPVRSIMEARVFTLDKNQPVGKALEAFHRHRRGSFPITYRGKLMGMISEWDLVKQINSPLGVRVQDLMVKKPLVLKDTFTVLEAAKIMVMTQVRRLPVARDNILLGIATPGDILTHLIKTGTLSGLRRDKTPITQAMNREVSTLEPGLDAYEAVRIMKRGIGGLPVVEDSELLGIITERDIVDALRR